MKNELEQQMSRCTIPESHAQCMNECHEQPLETFTRSRSIPASTRNLNNSPQAALERLIRIAESNSGQCRIVGSFLLAWWNAAEHGGFDLTNLWAVDAAIAEDMITVFAHLVHYRCYPDSLGYGPHFQAIAQQWR
jgi:hypothetical protein